MKKNTLLFYLFLLMVVPHLHSQDIRFSQFYAAPMYSNPAFTGTTIEHRFVMNYRNQWPSIPGAFQSFQASYEYNADIINSGFGLVMSRQEAGTFGLTTNTVAFSYAYRFRLDRTLYLQPGLNLGYSMRSIDFSKLVFNDQLESNNATTLDVEAFGDDNVNYPDINAGLLLFAEHYWVSASVNHLNEPNQSLLGDESFSALPMRLTFQSGYRFRLSGPLVKRLSAKDITVAMHYETQAEFDQLDFGAYYNHEPFVFGFWYRGLPLFKRYEPGVANNDAFIVLLGYSVPDRNLRIGYSYDVTVSRLISDTGGAHEFSLIYEFASKKKKRKSRKFIVPCAKF